MNINQLIDKFNSLPIFLRLVLVIINLVVAFGIVGPSMISSNSTVAVWVGIVILGLDVFLTYKFSSETIKELKNL